jgi:hypothetical protein
VSSPPNPPDPALGWSDTVGQLGREARDLPRREGTAPRVVSMPRAEWFAEQEASYQEDVRPHAIRARVCAEAGRRIRDNSSAGRPRGPGQPRQAERHSKPTDSKGWKV